MWSFHIRMKWNKEQAVRRDWKCEGKCWNFFCYFFSSALHFIQDENMNVTCYLDVLLNVNLKYCIWFDVVVNEPKILVCLLGEIAILIKGLKLGLIWWPTLNWAHPLVGCAADVTCHITCDCHVTVHIIAMSAAMSSLLSTSSSSQQPRHSSCHHCVTWRMTWLLTWRWHR